MSIDRSLKLKDALVRHRNVLRRAERIERLKYEERWSEGGAVLGLPKVAHRKSHAGKKAAKEKAAAEGAAGLEGTEVAVASADTAKAAPAAKPAKEAKKK